jgi:hypothetical protein
MSANGVERIRESRAEMWPPACTAGSMPREGDFHLARLARLEAMLHDLTCEYANLKGARAHHLEDAISDLRTFIDRLREQQQPRDAARRDGVRVENDPCVT